MDIVALLPFGAFEGFFQGAETWLSFSKVCDVLFLRYFHELFEAGFDGFGHWPFAAARFARRFHFVPSHDKRVHDRQLCDLNSESQVRIVCDGLFGGYEMSPALAERIERQEFGRMRREAA